MSCIIGMLDFSDSYRNIHTQKQYKQLFEEYFERHRPAMDTFDAEYEALEQAAASEYAARTAAMFIEKEKEKIVKIRRWNRKTELFNEAFSIVTFVLPALTHYNKASSHKLADAVIECWNTGFPKNKIKQSNYETILSGYGTGLLSDLFRIRRS